MQHIISDFDGVIGDTATMNWTLVQTLHRDVKREAYLIDHHLGNVFEQPVVPFTPQTAARYYELYNERLARAHIERAVPHVHALGQDFRIHIVTSNCEHAIRRVLREAEIESAFGHVLGQEAHASKVEKFRTLLQELALAPTDTVYLTDTVGDLKEAAVVGIPTIAVTFGYHPRQLLEGYDPTAVANDWPTTVRLVRELMST